MPEATSPTRILAAAAPNHAGSIDINSTPLSSPPNETSFSASVPQFMQLRKAALNDGKTDISSSDHPVPSSSYPSLTLAASPPRIVGSSLAVVSPRSSSLPSASMGHSHSKSVPAPPVSAPSSSAAPKAFHAAVSSGNKLKRAFVSRRKKSEDSTSLFSQTEKGKEQDSRHQLGYIQQNSSALPSTSTLSSTQVKTSSSPNHAQSKGARQLTHLATQVFHVGSKKSSKSPVEAPLPPPPPPLPPKASSIITSQSISVIPAHQLRPPVDPSSNSRSSIIPVSPAIESALDYMRMGGEIQDKIMDEREYEKGDKGDLKETWRKSDSTIGHHTIRQGAASNNRTSRPVSVAESFQSTHTIVPVNKRSSVPFVIDPDFGMPEEEDELSKSIKGNAALPGTHLTTSASSASRNRRSMSLNFGSPVFTQTLPSAPQQVPSATELKHTSVSISEGVSPFVPSMTMQDLPELTRADANGFISPTLAGSQSTGNHIRGKLSAWTASSSGNVLSDRRKLPPVPSPAQAQRTVSTSSHVAPSLRQTAISMTNGFAPAAGLAKRAVEKMGRAWGISSNSAVSGYTSSSSSNAPSSYSSAHSDYSLARTSSNQSNPSIHAPNSLQKGRLRRTPHAASESYSISSSMTSASDSDPFVSSPGPILGKLVRGPLRTKTGVQVAGKVVFGRDLKLAVRDTAIYVGRPKEKSQSSWSTVKGENSEHLRALEERKVPALVARCAQHLFIWGILEEGLFRVSGRPAHVAKIRAEFDTGVDYDMTDCAPGDLDPHAVASVFKAYLRELPEPILTHALLPYFDAAINQESINASDVPSGIKTSSRNGGFSSSLRKPPSLSTLAMPSFTGLRPPSRSLIKALRTLIAQLPEENCDLIRTVVELIRLTAKHAKETKMPLSNLLLVLCPSLNMNPSLLRILCEEQLWTPDFEESPIIDIKRASVVIDISSPSSASEDEDEFADAQEKLDNDSMGRASQENLGSDYDGSVEDSMIMEERDPRRRWTAVERPDVPTVYLDSQSGFSSTSVSSGQPNESQDVRHATRSNQDNISISSDGFSPPHHLASISPPPLSSSSESVATPTTSSGQPSFSHLPLDNPDDTDNFPKQGNQEVVEGSPKIAEPMPFALHPRTIKSLISSPQGAVQFPTSSVPESAIPSSKRRSIPVLSLPGFSSHGNPDPPSPAGSNSSRNSLRMNKPSLKLLFSKRSTSSLGGTRPFISNPIPQGESGPYLRAPRAASDSSVSTPLSAVTAPQASMCDLPPTIDTPIEGSSLDFDMLLPTGTTSPVTQKHPEDPSSPNGRPTPIADWYCSPSASTSRASLASPMEPEINIEKVTVRDRSTSVSSTTSSLHLGFLDDDNSQEDWSRSVLSAADVDGRWTNQRS